MSTPCFAASAPTRSGVLTNTRTTRTTLHTGRIPRVARRRTRTVAVSLDAPRERRENANETSATESKIDLKRVIETPGGYIVDIEVFHRSKTTKHTVIVGKQMISDLCSGLVSEAPPEKVVEFSFQFLMAKGQSLSNTEGLQDSDVFPVNYFSLRQVFYFYPEAHEKIASACKSYVEA